jgi:hypothetical protein
VAVWANTGDAMVANAIAATQASFDLLVILLSIDLREFVSLSHQASMDRPRDEQIKDF